MQNVAVTPNYDWEKFEFAWVLMILDEKEGKKNEKKKKIEDERK